MRRQGWCSRLVTVAVLAMQVSVSALGLVGMCVDRPHTHGGVPAPDCVMHHGQTESTPPDTSSHGHHHQHDESTAPDTARLACSCSGDPITLLTAEIAVVPARAFIAWLDIATPALQQRVQPAPDVRLVPPSPPPKPSLA